MTSIHDELSDALLRHGAAMSACVHMNERLGHHLNNTNVTLGLLADLMWDAARVTDLASERAREALEVMARMGVTPRE